MRSHSYFFATIIVGSVLIPYLLHAQSLYNSTDTLKEQNAPPPNYFQSQTKQFGIYVGADLAMGLGFRASTLSYSDATALVDATATPKIGFFPVDQLLVGGCFDFFGSLASFDAFESYALYSQTWGGFMRYYLKGGFFGEMQYSRGRGYEYTQKEEAKVLHDFQSERYSIGVGIANFWTEHFNFEVLLKYSNSSGHFNDTRGIYLSGLSLTAGVGFSINRRPKSKLLGK